MSHNFSNIYASRVYAEHPLALWALDDEVYFKSLTGSAGLLVSTYTENDDNAEWIQEFVTPKGVPVKNESRGVLRKTSAASVTYSLISDARGATLTTTLDPTKDTVCFSTYVYAYGSLIDSYEIGFRYPDESVDKKIYNAADPETWQKLEITAPISISELSFTPYVKINYLLGGSTNDYDVMFNAISIGQWSETFNHDSTGVIGEELNENDLKEVLVTQNFLVTPVDAYGFQDSDNGYVLIENNKLLAHNTNFPMVYGSGNVTEISSPITAGLPSIVFPGKGFLNKNGQYTNITAEFWLRLNPNLFTQTKIFGPVASSDGLYVDNEFMTLKIGKYIKSYFVGKWYRPMLVDIRYSSQIASVLINGDVVIEININTSEIDFPLRNFDWVGFYGHENITPFQIDCFALYPYVVPDQTAKRRFIFGQAVLNSELISNNFLGEAMVVDFPFANYSSTINYPDMNSWNAGYFNNLDANSRYLGFKEYSLPDFKFVGATATFQTPVNIRDWTDFQLQAWRDWLKQSWLGVVTEEATDILTDNYYAQVTGEYPFIKIRPNNAYANINGYLDFDTINPIPDRVNSIYGVFQAPPTLTSTPQTIMHFYNSLNSNIFKVTINNEGLKYIYNDQVLQTIGVAASANFAAGINIDTIASNYAGVVGNFFSNPQNISMTLMGYGSTNTFLGKMFGVTFNNSFFTNKDMSSMFQADGFATVTTPPESFEYVGAYSLKPVIVQDGLILDVCSAGYWEDSIPLSYFGKLVSDKSGLSYYDLDMIQFNLDYPTQIISNPSSSVSFYGDANVRAYLTLQDKDSVGNVSYLTYTNTEDINNKVIDFDNTTDVINTKFEITDGTIIFPPKELVDFSDYYLTIHLEVISKGVNSKPIKIKRMSLSSIASDSNSFFKIGTRTGNSIYPISRYNNTYAYKEKNPFAIYKDSTPYLYLTGDSGVGILPYESNNVRALSIPINYKQSPEFIFGGFQVWAMYNKDLTINETKNIMRVNTEDRKYDFVLQPLDSGKRGIIKVYDSETGLEDTSTVFYQNGNLIRNPIIYPLVWSSIVVSFGQNINLNSTIGQLELYEGMLYNNISSFRKSSEILGQSIDARTWQEVRQTEYLDNDEIVIVDFQWEDWYPFLWDDVYSINSILTFSLDGSSITKSYLGVSSIVSDDSSTISLNSEGVDIISDVVWSTTFAKPV